MLYYDLLADSPALHLNIRIIKVKMDIIISDDKSSGLSYKDREERVRQLRERQQLEKQQKLEELKEQVSHKQSHQGTQDSEHHNYSSNGLDRH